MLTQLLCYFAQAKEGYLQGQIGNPEGEEAEFRAFGGM